MATREITAACLIALSSSLAFAGASTSLFDPTTGYRIARYRAPVGEDPHGGKRIAIDELERLVAEERAVLIDAMASDGAGPDPETGEWRIVTPRTNIPGSVWLADVGKGELDPVLEAYFKSNLERLTGGDKRRAIIIYCLSDCWMGWNAVRRASRYGYTSLYWYPDGTDGWLDFDKPLVPAKPAPMTAAKPAP